MTPEEIATKIVRQYAVGLKIGDMAMLHGIIAKALHLSITEEREACAKLVEEQFIGDGRIAKAIRARRNKP